MPTCESETLSVGRLRSRNDAPEINHLDIGAQKCLKKKEVPKKKTTTTMTYCDDLCATDNAITIDHYSRLLQ